VHFIPEQSLKTYAEGVLLALDSETQARIEEVIYCLINATLAEKRIWIIGNGGSSATASHFSADLMRQSLQEKFKVRATSLSESLTRITALGNDYGFEVIFENQIQKLADEGDVLVLLSASGKSLNLIKALHCAKGLGLKTVSLVGFQGGALKQESDICLHFLTKEGAYETAEDSQSIVCHYIAINVRQGLDHQSKFEKKH